MKFVDEIPPQHIPDQSRHVYHEKVVRALKDNRCDVNSFLPTFLEPGRTKSASFDPNDPESYSLSLFRTVEELNAAVRPYAGFWKNHKGIAFGSTKGDKGIALPARDDGHIAFFLYDTYNNNPCVDFELIIKTE